MSECSCGRTDKHLHVSKGKVCCFEGTLYIEQEGDLRLPEWFLYDHKGDTMEFIVLLEGEEVES